MTGKNNAAEKPVEPNDPGMGNIPQMPQMQSLMAVVVPVEIFDQMKRAVKRQPYEDVELLLQAMKNLIPQQVNMQAAPPRIPQA